MTAAMELKDARVQPPNKAILPVVIAAGLAAGVLPFLLYKSVVFLLAPYFVWNAVAAWWMSRDFVSHATTRPTLLEWFLAGWSAVGIGATASIVGFIWYGIAYGAITSFAWGANAVGWTMGPDPSVGATYVSVVFVAMFGLAGPFIVGNELPARLYPRLAGIRSAFFPIAAKPWALVPVAGLGLVGCILGLVLLGLNPRGLWFNVLLTTYLVGSAAPLQEQSRGKRSAAGTTALKAIRRLYSAAGYKLIDRPRTDDPELDPLAATIDLLAIASNRAYAVQIAKAPSDESGVEESTVFEVRAGARVLQRALRKGDTPDIRVEPYLFAVGGQISESMHDFCRDVGVTLVHVASVESLSPAICEKDSVALRGMALRMLQVPLAGEPIAFDAGEQAEQGQR